VRILRAISATEIPFFCVHSWSLFSSLRRNARA
jgi:hypothetical protein